MRRGWAYCRRRGHIAGVSGVRVRHLSAPEMDRRGIDGRLGIYDPYRIGCHNDIEWEEGRACGKKEANSVRRWEASPSHGLGPANCATPAKDCGAGAKSREPILASHEHRRTLSHHVVTLSYVWTFVSIVGIALRSHRNASGASAPTSALAGKGTARTRPRAHKARAEREEAHHGHQEECQGGTTCARPSPLPLPPPR
jgi:hypothetical protein